MSKWTEIRDGALEAMKQSAMDVTEDAKKKFLDDFQEAAVPVIEAWAEHFSSAVQAQAEAETGWCKIRDAFIIPAAIKILLWIGKQILTFTMSRAAKETAA